MWTIVDGSALARRLHRAKLVLESLFDLTDEEATWLDAVPSAPVEPTDVPVEVPREITAKLTSGPQILFREHHSLTCRWHDEAGAPIMISY